MPNKELHSRVIAVEKRLDEHIHDGIGVWKAIEGLQVDLRWIKRALWTLVSLLTILAPFMVKIMLNGLKTNGQ